MWWVPPYFAAADMSSIANSLLSFFFFFFSGGSRVAGRQRDWRTAQGLWRTERIDCPSYQARPARLGYTVQSRQSTQVTTTSFYCYYSSRLASNNNNNNNDATHARPPPPPAVLLDWSWSRDSPPPPLPLFPPIQKLASLLLLLSDQVDRLIHLFLLILSLLPRHTAAAAAAAAAAVAVNLALNEWPVSVLFIFYGSTVPNFSFSQSWSLGSRVQWKMSTSDWSRIKRRRRRCSIVRLTFSS